LVPLLRTLFFLKANIKNISYFCFQKNRSRNGTSFSDLLAVIKAENDVNGKKENK